MNSKWLRCVYQKQNAKLRLICFPWAGGGAAFYANWGKKFASEVEGLIYKFWRMLFSLRVIWSRG